MEWKILIGHFKNRPSHTMRTFQESNLRHRLSRLTNEWRLRGTVWRGRNIPTDVHGFYSDFRFTFKKVFATKKSCLEKSWLMWFLKWPIHFPSPVSNNGRIQERWKDEENSTCGCFYSPPLDYRSAFSEFMPALEGLQIWNKIKTVSKII